MTKLARHYYIYPAIGIARVGNSESEYLISPEVINQQLDADQDYKDKAGKVKRQAAKFRIYALDENGKVLEEMVCSDKVQIEWSVHLANRKAINYQFNNAMDVDDLPLDDKQLAKALAKLPDELKNLFTEPGNLAMDCNLRNPDIVDLEKRKQLLLLDPGKRKIAGKSRHQGNAGKKENFTFDSAKFYQGTRHQQDVYLGELQTDEQGRLLVLGGRGKSASFDGQPAVTFANNNGWHDDVADGTVRAKIIIDGEKFTAEPAMVAVTPPNFAPGIEGTVTLLDVVQDLFEKQGLLEPIKNVSFYRDIYPIFKSLVDNQAVNAGFYFLFGENAPGNFTSGQLLEKISDNSSANRELRQYLFDQFRPSVTAAKVKRIKALADIYQQHQAKHSALSLQVGEIARQAISASQEAIEADQLPPFYGDAYADYTDNPLANLSLTDRQYQALKCWSEGYFNCDVPEPPIKCLEQLPLQQQPQALTQGHLAQCLGGPFHPGIELTWFLRRISMWNTKDPLDKMRLNILAKDQPVQDYFGPVLTPAVALAQMFNASGPGTLTRFMGVPWQTDEGSCRSGQDYDPAYYLPLASFWSARVPNQVLSERSFARLSDKNLPPLQRLKHLDYRQDWLRFFNSTVYQTQINGMVSDWSKIGIVKEKKLDPPLKIENYELSSLWVESEVNKKFTVNDPSYRQLLHMENLANASGEVTPPDQNKTYLENLRELERNDCDFADNAEPKRPTFTRQQLFGEKD
ncbi:LodA/GoxA family CTQ-dependent oxidase [Thalassomonas sp. RHCl1]|uniref:LodA/GoxA family CTQ-dependent oxidase n=1 Tax=Thalassomonas sp. RHCl1 TaxID=2995320 RepID=UPI00248CA541|nr:LodA/GoxA family CTQ-dependent oxidase [Thalassomonas sp. RHCl1]